MNSSCPSGRSSWPNSKSPLLKGSFPMKKSRRPTKSPKTLPQAQPQSSQSPQKMSPESREAPSSSLVHHPIDLQQARRMGPKLVVKQAEVQDYDNLFPCVI